MDRQDFIPVERGCDSAAYVPPCDRGRGREGAAYAPPCSRGRDRDRDRDRECDRDRAQEADCEDRSRERRALAMAYVPMQRFRALYRPEEGLRAGTLFRELDKPFTGRCGRRCDHA